MRECKYCGCFLPEGADTCLSCGKPQEENKKVEMTNQTIKENLIDAYTVCAGNLDDQEK